MSEYVPKRTKLEELAQLIEQDIVRRGLKPGDRYLTAQDVGDLFEVHQRQANRAMNLLAERKLLERKAAVGTVVGSAAAKFAPSQANGIHVLVGIDRLHSGLRTDVLLQALASEIPGSEIKFTILNESVTLADVNEILDRNAASNSVLGVVLLGCDRQVQEAVAKRHLPAVVFGSVFPSANRLSSLDVDQREIGRLLAKTLLEKGHAKLAVVTHQVWLPGDNDYLDGIHAAISEHTKPVPPPAIRACPVSPEILESEIAQLLSQKTAPDALICRSANIAEVALRIAPNVPVAYDDPDPLRHFANAVCLVEPAESFLEQATQTAALLRKISEDASTPAQHRTIPVRIAR